MAHGIELCLMALIVLIASVSFAVDQKRGADDAAEVIGKHADMAGEVAVRERAQKEAEQKAKDFLKGKKPGEGVIVHKDFYDVPTHPDSVLHPKDIIVYTGGSGRGKGSAILNDSQPKITPNRSGEKTSTESIYFEKQPDNSIKQDSVTRQEVDRIVANQNVSPPAPRQLGVH